MEKLNLISPVNNLGYGVVGHNLLKHLAQKLDIALFPVGGIDVERNTAELVEQVIRSARNFKDRASAPCLKVWHEFDLAMRVGFGPYYAFPFFELNKIDDKRLNHLSSTDGIIVASKWAQEILNQHSSLVDKTSVVPLGVDTSVFNHSTSNITNDTCIFFNCGKWEKRKGHDILLEMFQKAFPEQADVELWVLASNPFIDEKSRDEWERYYSSDTRVKIISRVDTQHQVAYLMSQANCGVFPSRAEGWNLELLEMMAMGKHVITTNYSAHTEFCNENNSRLINIQQLEPAQDGVFFDGSIGEWASLEGEPFDEGVDHMRAFYQEWQSNHNIVNEHGLQTAQELSLSNTATQLEEVIYGNPSTKTIENNTVTNQA